MVEIKLRWRIKHTSKNGKIYQVCYISVPYRSAIFLLDYEPVLDPINKVIILRPKQSNAKQEQRDKVKMEDKVHEERRQDISLVLYFSTI